MFWLEIVVKIAAVAECRRLCTELSKSVSSFEGVLIRFITSSGSVLIFLPGKFLLDVTEAESDDMLEPYDESFFLTGSLVNSFFEIYLFIA